MNILTTTAPAATTDSNTWAASLATAARNTQGSLNLSASSSSSDGASDSGDTVTISDAAKSLAAQASATDSESTAETTVAKIRKMIEEVQQQIKQAQNDPGLTEDERKAIIQLLQAELMVLQTELAKQGSGSGVLGGTPAAGMANSLT